MRKITAYVITFCLLFTIFAAVPSPVKAAEVVELLTNGGFEKLKKDGSPDGWKISGTKWNEGMSLETKKAHEGNAVKMISEETNMFLSQTISVMEGKKYKLSAWINIADVGKNPGVKVEFYAVNAEGTREAKGSMNEYFKDIPLNRWQEQKLEFTPPEGATIAIVMFRMYKGGEFYWDDLSLLGEEMPDKEPIKKDDMRVSLLGTENLIKNGDFEELNSAGEPVDWKPIGSKWKDNAYATVDTDKKVSGNNSVKISTSSGGNPHISQTVAVQPNTEYQISSWIRQSAIDGGKGIKFKIEYYTDYAVSSENASLYEAGHPTDIFQAEEDNRWQQYAAYFTTPRDCKMIAVYARLFSNGTVWFDDISLQAVSEPKHAYLFTDEVFYYPSQTTGTLTAYANTITYPEIEGGKIDAKLKDGSTVLSEKSGIPLEDGQAVWEYDLSLLTEKKKEYTIEVTSYDGNGNLLSTETTDIYKYDRPQNVTEDGQIFMDGKVFEPSFAYHAKVTMCDEMKAAGVNLMQFGYGYMENTESALAALDTLNENGIKSIVCLYRNMFPAAHPYNYELSENLIKAVKDHPGVFGYAVMDEPAAQISNYDEYLKESYKLIRNLDDKHAVFINEATPKVFEKVARYCDVFATDPYPSSKGEPETFVTQVMRQAEEAVKAKKPTLALLQAFNYGNYFPTGNEYRHMWYQALLEGSAGNGMFALDTVMATDLWPALTEFAKEELALSYDLFTYGKNPLFGRGDTAEATYATVIKDGAIYALVLNRSNEKKTTQIPLTSANELVKVSKGTVLPVFGCDGGKATISDAGLTVELTERQAALYKITPTDGADLSKVPYTSFWDLAPYPWAYDAIASTEQKDIVNAKGKHLYMPEAKITRGDFAMFLVKTLGLTAEAGENFSDVNPDAVYAKEVAIGKALGILKGVDGQHFQPESEISRQDLMVICARGMRIVKALAEEGTIGDFPDADAIAEYAVADIAAMVRANIVKGNADGTINPRGNATRAEAAVIMARILEWKAGY